MKNIGDFKQELGPLSQASNLAKAGSDELLVSLLERVKIETDPKQIEVLTDQIERTIFHKQHQDA